MKFSAVWLVAALLCLVASPVFAQDGASTDDGFAPPAEKNDGFEPPAYPPEGQEGEMPSDAFAVEPTEELSLDDLEKLESLENAEAIEKEQLNFFELNGYFRVRADMFHNLDMGVYNELRPLRDLGTADSDSNLRAQDDTIGSANMRLRLMPTLNVSEDIQIHMQLDVFDNLVLGSTPDTINWTQNGPTATGIQAFSASTEPMRQGVNSTKNSVEFKRVWAQVRTPFGIIRFGRMPSHWGLGMYVNDGNAIDADYGDTIDRILFGTKLMEHTLFVSMDFPNEGLTNEDNFEFGGQAKDATQMDDVNQWVFGFARKDNDVQIKELLESGEVSVNYGLYNVFRWQSYSIENWDIANESHLPAAGNWASRDGLRNDMIRRDMNIYVGDVWFRLLYEHFHMELEAAWITGSMDNATVSPTDVDNEGISIDQYGLVVQFDYKFLNESLFLGFEYGLASGDPYPGDDYTEGFGVYPSQDSQFGSYYRTKNGPEINDRAVTNFRFDRDYHVDLILFREILGCVTDAMYFKWMFQYLFTPDIGFKFDLIYSRAMEADSTPSYDHQTLENKDDALPIKRKTDPNLGVELDLDVFYTSVDGFGIGLQYGVLFPLGGFGYWDPNHYSNTYGQIVPTWFEAPDVAQTVQLRMFVEF